MAETSLEQVVVKKIITHSGPAHSDEFLAVSLLLHKHPDAFVERVADFVRQPEEGEVVVDVGRRYDGRRFFDHHHDKDLPCSFILVLRDFFQADVDNLPVEFKYIDLRDRFGAYVAKKVLNMDEDRGLVERAMLKYFSTVTLLTPEHPLHHVMRHVGESVLALLDDFLFAKNGVKLFPTSLGYVVFSPKPVNLTYIREAHADKHIIGAVMPSRDGGTMLIQANEGKFIPKATSYPKTFVHNSGFAVVVPIPYEQIDPLKIVMECVMGV